MSTEAGAHRQKMPERVLIVDDDKNILDAYRRRLGRALHVEICDDPVEALQLLEGDEEYAVIISDFLMPKMNGVQFLAKCKQRSPQSVRMMVTGISDFGTSVDAVNAGSVFRFLIKPCPPEVLGQALVDGIRQFRLEQAEGKLLRETLLEAIRLVVDAATVANPTAFADVRRLSEAVRAVASRLDEDRAGEIEVAWLLSSVGQLALPEALLASQSSGIATHEEASAAASVRHVSSALAASIPQLETIAGIIEGEGASSKPKKLPGTTSAIGSSILSVFRAITALKADGIEDSELGASLRGLDIGLDARVIKAVEEYYSTAGEAGFPSPVSVEELRLGAILAGDVRTKNGRVLAATGTHLGHLLIERIRNFAATEGIEEPLSVYKKWVTVNLESAPIEPRP